MQCDATRALIVSAVEMGFQRGICMSNTGFGGEYTIAVKGGKGRAKHEAVHEKYTHWRATCDFHPPRCFALLADGVDGVVLAGQRLVQITKKSCR